MAKFRKKPVEIEARQYLNDESSYEVLHWINEGQHANGSKQCKSGSIASGGNKKHCSCDVCF